MTDTVVEDESGEQPVQAASSATSDEQLISSWWTVLGRRGLQLTGEGGLLQQLTKRVLESALEGEITDHVERRTAGVAQGSSGPTTAGVVGRASDLHLVTARDEERQTNEACLLGVCSCAAV